MADSNGVTVTERPRKRRRQPDQWARHQKKKARNTGKSYIVHRSQKTVPERRLGEDCRCQKHCFTRISADQREQLFSNYYKLASHDLQTAFICGSVCTKAVNRRYSRRGDASRRQLTYQYSVLVERQDVEVCKKAFLSMIGVSKGRVDRALAGRVSENGTPKTDGRGTHATRPNRISEAKIKVVKEHISSFPQYESHYSCSQNPHAKYLHPDLSISRMYRLYREKCDEENADPVKESMYRKIFVESFNLRFGQPKSDTCKMCDQYNGRIAAETNPVSKRQLITEWEVHKAKAKQAFDRMKEDERRAKSGEILMLTFDLQQALPTPSISTSIVFYLRQLWTYNLGIHNVASGDASMYMWPEHIGGRGSDEIGSCLLHYIQQIPEDVRHLVVYSDSCGGQNKNFNITAMWMYLVECGKFDTIEHKFLISGHTYMHCDRDFGLIEKKKRKAQSVYVPEDWMKLVETARVRNPFQVVRMTADDFLSIQCLTVKLTNRKTTTNKEKLEFRKVLWFLFDKRLDRFHYAIRYSHNDLLPWQNVDVTKRARGRPSTAPLSGCELPKKYAEQRDIAPQKCDDILKLLPYIPPEYHDYYRQLCSGTSEEVAD